MHVVIVYVLGHAKSGKSYHVMHLLNARSPLDRVLVVELTDSPSLVKLLNARASGQLASLFVLGPRGGLSAVETDLPNVYYMGGLADDVEYSLSSSELRDRYEVIRVERVDPSAVRALVRYATLYDLTIVEVGHRHDAVRIAYAMAQYAAESLRVPVEVHVVVAPDSPEPSYVEAFERFGRRISVYNRVGGKRLRSLRGLSSTYVYPLEDSCPKPRRGR